MFSIHTVHCNKNRNKKRRVKLGLHNKDLKQPVGLFMMFFLALITISFTFLFRFLFSFHNRSFGDVVFHLVFQLFLLWPAFCSLFMIYAPLGEEGGTASLHKGALVCMGKPGWWLWGSVSHRGIGPNSSSESYTVYANVQYTAGRNALQNMWLDFTLVLVNILS